MTTRKSPVKRILAKGPDSLIKGHGSLAATLQVECGIAARHADRAAETLQPFQDIIAVEDWDLEEGTELENDDIADVRRGTGWRPIQGSQTVTIGAVLNGDSRKNTRPFNAGRDLVPLARLPPFKERWRHMKKLTSKRDVRHRDHISLLSWNLFALPLEDVLYAKFRSREIFLTPLSRTVRDTIRAAKGSVHTVVRDCLAAAKLGEHGRVEELSQLIDVFPRAIPLGLLRKNTSRVRLLADDDK